MFFDPASPGDDREQSVLDTVSAQAPDIPWDVKNQAAYHLWHPQVLGVEVEPLTSSVDELAHACADALAAGREPARELTYAAAGIRVTPWRWTATAAWS